LEGSLVEEYKIYKVLQVGRE